MHIILGATGHVGAATARALLKRGEPVTVVTRDATRASDLKKAGAKVAIADVLDTAKLREVFRTGSRAFLLNPPAAPPTDTDTEERATAAAIVEALNGSGLKKVVAASVSSARAGERCGDLTVLHEFEERLRAQPIPVATNRGGYYMSNWLEMLDSVRERGKLPCFFPADVPIPMVAPQDLGEIAARRMLEPEGKTGVVNIEGPKRYTPRDVARAFVSALRRPVEVETIPREKWVETYRKLGFSEQAAKSYACMTGVVVDEPAEITDNTERGMITLREYIERAVNG
ncbi:NmrA family transcriptional regulator OS=Massilia sp. JS1662 GN=IA69_09970 PE=4 SV=1: NmrA [Gemmata massiliana]|uniref:NmrA-like domain-containing protein n=1 Tax=Gemmata massiliana TaxID=1210884 RepID=A0A6P2D6M2_9BACT|nr:NmrA family NAD(P)-binding protein [Gemmata massiliana]VTR95112.1 NmrA family transcriptional regulator OS=Massilia sp. JS1662 GN=IA69_09970 PE=4 SV=1: NmrA [Gemmata massiliana]